MAWKAAAAYAYPLRRDRASRVTWHVLPSRHFHGSVRKDSLSMQVLQKALEVFGLSCQNLDSPECADSAEHPENEVAFICNLRVAILLTSLMQVCYASAA